MQEVLKLQQKIVPELMDLLEKRYNILRAIYYNQPIGRRILANHLEIGERIVRTEINFLKKQNLINISTPGMTVTAEGEEIINKLKDFIHEFKGLSEIEQSLKKVLKIKDVIIVPGDVEEDHTVMKELGRTAAQYVKRIIKDNTIVAVTGGTTIKEVVDSFPCIPYFKNTTVVPARGAMERMVETEANTLAARFANKLGAKYKLLSVPENLSDLAFSTILNEKSIKNVINMLHNADVVIYGIGRADEMSTRRGLSQEEINVILEKKSVGEAFGYYFDKKGKVVHSTPSIGLSMEDIKKIDNLVAVAGGKSKADAIVSTQLSNDKNVLITDEGTAIEMLNITNDN
ncbi:central glycolytic genes regulator [Clostridium pasteurianum DSM 525 = ATCC 6013]|uniref:Central glycolytic genes regulator n=1 Tax=Clostridium pasteurianum DSM 525 = ATCC 6013 TaxID=1262449 RepID=A0A0H3J9Q3_CLOPA|nr:sugar-binding domain-containing protein [Clostridium pasteurianum]AJA48888.1 central glycolytic genes regulator [Clostridium pasteurianum DSM 525 = ATCC 6013]AJA52876.1 central glycolytic genes regulator [Clostridium pasteurianum DSM 525 = ATCC 6013]AOZ76098.1 Cro/Cl family transcriptional regulator [Clostridium pasteurianum DSM 525 = ATCC 6013]AOZ79894.1 Cro/Cl family transcriptional regulator [Clostridium pasteurianum]ELP60184.1 Putative transcriptional regulator [Clostridium pasteurianum